MLSVRLPCLLLHLRSKGALVAIAGTAMGGGEAHSPRCRQMAKSECRLDHYKVRHWQGWFRHITLSMRALACHPYCTLGRENLLPARFLSVCWKSGICSVLYCAAVGTVWTIFSSGMGGGDGIKSSSNSPTVTSRRYGSSLHRYNCSTK